MFGWNRGVRQGSATFTSVRSKIYIKSWGSHDPSAPSNTTGRGGGIWNTTQDSGEFGGPHWKIIQIKMQNG